MIEKTILDFIKNKIDVPIVLEREGETAPFVLLEKTGSGRTNYINSATFAFQSYGETLYKAAKLNDEVKVAVFSLVELGLVSRVELNSDYNFTDTTTKDYRYQALFDITYMEE